MVKYQTIRDFIRQPFFKPNKNEVRFRKSYTILRRNIKLVSYTIIEHSYYVHLKIPSESDKEIMYDVVIRFFDPINDTLLGRMDLSKYYLQFFSNSPSFIYNYSVLYAKNGYLIELLMDKQDPLYRNRLPKKPVSLEIDKSLYLACSYLLEHVFSALNSLGIMINKKKSINDFIRGIKSFEDMNLTSDMVKLERRFDRLVKDGKYDMISNAQASTGYSNANQLRAERTTHYINKDTVKKKVNTSKNALRTTTTNHNIAKHVTPISPISSNTHTKKVSSVSRAKRVRKK